MTMPAAMCPPPNQPAAGANRSGGYVIAAALFAGALALFLPSIGFDLVHYDDPGFVVQANWVRQGLTWSGVAHAFASTEMANWHPLTWLSYLVDVQLFGTAPWGFHLTNAILHALNTVLVFGFLRRLTGRVWSSAFVAALFAVHPAHVESVAWISERKDVLCTAFFFASLWCYAEWQFRRKADAPAARWYGLALGAFALGLMAKPMVVTLPCVLLLLDYWPLGRWGRAGSANVRPVVEKIPFLMLSIADSVITVKAQAGIGAVLGFNQMAWGDRVANAVVSYASYLGQAVFPCRLAVYYPYSRHTLAALLVAAAILVVGSALALANGRRRPYVLFGWLWYLGTLVPVIGLVQVGGQAMADRYTYIPFVGLFIAAVWWVSGWPLARRGRGGVTVLGAAAVLVGLAAVAARQLTYWKNTGTLFHHALLLTQANVPAHLGLGFYYSQHPGRLSEAIAEYREAVRLAPTIDDTHRGLAAVLARSPETLPEAVAEYQAAVRLNPRHVPTLLALGETAEKVPGDLDVAIEAYQAAVRLEPDNADAHNRLGNALARDPARVDEAIAEYRRTIHLQPDWVEVHLNLGATLATMPGRLNEAIAEYRTVLRAKPGFADVHNNLANALTRLPGHAAEAAAEYETAIRLNPAYVEARFNYAVLLGLSLGRQPEAIAQLESVVRIQPDFEPARKLLAQLRGNP